MARTRDVHPFPHKVAPKFPIPRRGRRPCSRICGVLPMDEIVLARMCALAIVQNEKEKDVSSAAGAVRELADLGPVSFR